MKNLFPDTENVMERYSLILDKAVNRKMALENCADYFYLLLDDGIETDIDDLIELASDYDFDFDNFKDFLKNYE